MPRYFFHIKDGKDITDTEGTELGDIAQARNQAIVAAGEMIRQTDTVWNGSDWRMDVTDEAFRCVATEPSRSAAQKVCPSPRSRACPRA
jgi:hypothetical protein